VRLVFVVFVLFFAASTLACGALSKSSESISDSISSPSKSSSESSGGDDDSGEPEAPQDKASYEADVAQLAATFAAVGGDIGALRSAVSELAVKRGITNWEADSATRQAIGRGVGDGGMEEAQFADFSKDLFGDDLTKQSDLRKGYQATAPTASSGAS
jgi:hypothetical protein